MHSAATDMKFNFRGSRSHALTTANHAGEVIDTFRWQHRIKTLPAQVGPLGLADQHGKGAIRLENNTGAVESDHAAGNCLHDSFELTTALFNRQVGGDHFRGGALS